MQLRWKLKAWFSNQVHGTKVLMVDENDRGKGLVKESDLKGSDGLFTVTPNVTLVTFHADCAPIFLFEPSINAAALLHSGWKGTLSDIVLEAMSAMKKIPGFDAGRVEAVIGSIGFAVSKWMRTFTGCSGTNIQMMLSTAEFPIQNGR